MRSTDEIMDAVREVQGDMTHNRDMGNAAILGAQLADLVKELDERLSAGEPLPRAWQSREK